jgi:hypothetical protein
MRQSVFRGPIARRAGAHVDHQSTILAQDLKDLRRTGKEKIDRGEVAIHGDRRPIFGNHVQLVDAVKTERAIENSVIE